MASVLHWGGKSGQQKTGCLLKNRVSGVTPENSQSYRDESFGFKLKGWNEQSSPLQLTNFSLMDVFPCPANAGLLIKSQALDRS